MSPRPVRARLTTVEAGQPQFRQRQRSVSLEMTIDSVPAAAVARHA